MVKDNTNSYFTNLTDYLATYYSKLGSGTTYTATPASFPYLYFKQIEGSTALRTLSNTEEGINIGLEIKIYSKKASEARTISNKVREYMIGKGFSCDYFSPVENVSDTSVSQFISRYSKLDT